ncbi:hypothetical protein [Fulvivirga sedimenti]|uniref:Uncharacterized protein n=1 Tax=Fulvivirga sedimenti TaxID=2879465 RepID=A0A9X1HQ76_9BACT|nr:hypothetical protein [Fulvivirga sedimenti]MCA6075126.1 hypothetical protein [Fulvivirga sedimenti]MCA6076303.1 hypothetical protein [Fulvivirga sedimenti]MCA6077431.1 hypothetical protein [Fulvivirga sedimenti]
MGLFWNLIQQSQISQQSDRASTLEARVQYLEVELRKTQELLIKTLTTLEEYTGRDINKDGRIG